MYHYWKEFKKIVEKLTYICYYRNIDKRKERGILMGYIEITDIKDMLKKTGELYGDRPAYKYKTETPGEFKIIY